MVGDDESVALPIQGDRALWATGPCSDTSVFLVAAFRSGATRLVSARPGRRRLQVDEDAELQGGGGSDPLRRIRLVIEVELCGRHA
jgi:hypothetical protein